LLGSRLEVVGGRVDEPDRAAGCLEQLDAVGALLREDLDDRAFGAGREAAQIVSIAAGRSGPGTTIRAAQFSQPAAFIRWKRPSTLGSRSRRASRNSRQFSRV
jgi:hypothetical protein